MCRPDLTLFPLEYTYWDKSGRPVAYENNVNIHHTCRDWDRILEWAQPRSDRIKALPNFPAAG